MLVKDCTSLPLVAEKKHKNKQNWKKKKNHFFYMPFRAEEKLFEKRKKKSQSF